MNDWLIASFGLEPFWLLVFFLTALLGFVASSAFGVGGAIVLVPVLMLRLDAALSVALAAHVMLVSNILKFLVFRRHVAPSVAFAVCIGALPSAAVAAFYVDRIDEVWLRAAIGVLTLVSVVWSGQRPQSQLFPRWSAGPWGIFIGLLSGLCGAAGPPTAIALRGFGLQKEAFIATVAVLAIGLQVSKIPGYFVTGVMTEQWLPLALWLSSAAFIAVFIAAAWVPRMDAALFRRALNALLVAMGLYLLVPLWVNPR